MLSFYTWQTVLGGPSASRERLACLWKHGQKKHSGKEVDSAFSASQPEISNDGRWGNTLNSSYGNTPAAALNFVKAFLIVFRNTPSQSGCCFTLASTGKLKFKCSALRFGKRVKASVKLVAAKQQHVSASPQGTECRIFFRNRQIHVLPSY